ncbi:MAG: hypothetical protein PVG91_09860 [Gammaproteobacteria bacterium]|jgi:hypothetical protein
MTVALTLFVLAAAAAVAAGLGRLRYRRRQAAHRHIFNALALPNVTEDRCEIRQLILLPPPACRYLRRALPADGSLARTVDLYLVGRIRPRAGAGWIGFEAHQRICPERGFICAARLESLGPLAIEGADYLLEGQAGSDYFMGRIFPLVREEGEDLRRAAAGRLLIESIWLPATLVPESGVRWQPGDLSRATAVVPTAEGNAALNFLIAEDGGLVEVSAMLHEYGPGGSGGKRPFALRVEEEARWDGFTVPSRVIGIRDHGTDHPFHWLDCQVESARYF